MYLVFNADPSGNHCVYVVENIRASTNSHYCFCGDFTVVDNGRVTDLCRGGAFEMKRILGVFPSKDLALQFAKDFVGYKEFTMKNMEVGQVGRINNPVHSLHNEVFIRSQSRITILRGINAGQWFTLTNDLECCPVVLSTININSVT